MPHWVGQVMSLPKRSQSNQWPKAVSICLIWLTTVFCACKKYQTNNQDSDQPSKPGVEHSGGTVEPEFAPQQTGFKVTLHNLPADASSVRCKVNETPEVDCADGLILPQLADGLYLMTITISTPREGVVRSHQFSILDGQYYRGVVTKDPPNNNKPIDPGDAQDIKFTLKAGPLMDKLVNHSAVSRDAPLKLDVVLENNQSCLPQFWCSRGQDIWSLCNESGNADITLDPRELATGFQKLMVKASCPNTSFDSNIVERYWFGVSASYQPLSLTKRNVQGYTHYQMEKATDCLEEVSYECSAAGGQFQACSNVKIDPSAGFQIRVLCKKNGSVERGPVYSES